MNAPARVVLAAALMSALGSSPLSAQVLHVNHRWEECAFVIDPSLTQDAWHQFVGEVGLVTYFRPLVRLGAELNLTKVPGYAFRVAFGT
jgi:hypothetical protein